MSDPVNLESLEVIKGPSATLFGSTLTCYGGLVNRVTKKAYRGTGGQVGLSTGSFGLGRITVDYNRPLDKNNKLFFRLNTAFQREKSFQDYGQNKSMMIAPTFTYFVNDKLKLDFDLEYFQSERNTTYLRVSEGSINHLDDLNWDFGKSYTANQLLSSAKVLNSLVKATYKISDAWESQTAISYSNTDNNAYYLFLMVSKADSLERMVYNIPSMFNTLQVQQNFIGKFDIGTVKNKLLVGLDYTQLQTTDTRKRFIYDGRQIGIHGDETYLNTEGAKQTLAGMDEFFSSKRNRQNYSTYISDVASIGDRLFAMLSLRLDYFNDIEEDYDQSVFSPKAGLIYQVLDDKLSVFVNYMNGFNYVGKDYTNPEQESPVVLDPEHANQIEGGIKYELLGGKLNGTVSYYDITVENKVRYVRAEDNNYYAVQDATQSSKGIEFDLIANPVDGMHIILGYGYNQSEYTGGNDAIVGNTPYSVPEQVGNFWFSYRLTRGTLKGLGLGFGANYATDCYLDDANTITVPGHTVYDGTLFYEQPSFRIGLKMNNLTDEKYWRSAYDAEPQATSNFALNFILRF